MASDLEHTPTLGEAHYEVEVDDAGGWRATFYDANGHPTVLDENTTIELATSQGDRSTISSMSDRESAEMASRKVVRDHKKKRKADAALAETRETFTIKG